MKSVIRDLTRGEYFGVWDTMSYITSYMSSMNMNQIYELLWRQPMIIDCVLSGEFSLGAGCLDMKEPTWDPIYQGCYSFRIPENITEVRLVRYCRRHANY